MANKNPSDKVKFSSKNQPSKESRKKQGLTFKYTRELERKLLNELFKPDITVTDESGKPVKISSIEAGVKKLKRIMLTTKNEKLASDIFFKFMERMFGKPIETVEASVDAEVRNYSREEVIKMILDARKDKVIEVKQEQVLIDNSGE